MATKIITITKEAYERLVAYREYNESFSDIINKLTKKYTLRDLVGVLSKREADELRTHITEIRERMRKRVEETAKRLEQ